MRKVNKTWALSRLKSAYLAYEWGADRTAFKIIQRLIEDYKSTGEW